MGFSLRVSRTAGSDKGASSFLQASCWECIAESLRTGRLQPSTRMTRQFLLSEPTAPVQTQLFEGLTHGFQAQSLLVARLAAQQALGLCLPRRRFSCEQWQRSLHMQQVVSRLRVLQALLSRRMRGLAAQLQGLLDEDSKPKSHSWEPWPPALLGSRRPAAR